MVKVYFELEDSSGLPVLGSITIREISSGAKALITMNADDSVISNANTSRGTGVTVSCDVPVIALYETGYKM